MKQEQQPSSQVVAPAAVQVDVSTSAYSRQGGGMDWGRVIWDTQGINAYYGNIQNAIQGVDGIVTGIAEVIIQNEKKRLREAEEEFLGKMSMLEGMQADPDQDLNEQQQKFLDTHGELYRGIHGRRISYD